MALSQVEIVMKRIAMFCDGTWNRDDAPHPTNVLRLSQAVRLTAADGRKQQVFYIAGVGTGRGSNWLARGIDRYAGGMLGWGLLENIADAYRSLIFCYEPGDEIYIFGYSRGAYTARSLAGLLRSCGIPPRDNIGRLAEALGRYRSRDPRTRPDDPESFLFRSDFAPFTATSEAEWQWRLKTRPQMCVKLAVTYLGVWDTVGALGVPGYWSAAPFLNRQHQFHDADLSRMVSAARHAVAIDEKRKTFPPALWSDKLNDMNISALKADPAKPLDPDGRESWPYRQEWFPGDHGSVGGGGDRLGLSSFACDWIAQGAIRAGLDLDTHHMQAIRAGQNIHEKLVNQSTSGIMTRIMRKNAADRDGPDRRADVSDVARARIAADHTYRPATLRRVMDQAS